MRTFKLIFFHIYIYIYPNISQKQRYFEYVYILEFDGNRFKFYIGTRTINVSNVSDTPIHIIITHPNYVFYYSWPTQYL